MSTHDDTTRDYATHARITVESMEVAASQYEEGERTDPTICVLLGNVATAYALLAVAQRLESIADILDDVTSGGRVHIDGAER